MTTYAWKGHSPTPPQATVLDPQVTLGVLGWGREGGESSWLWAPWVNILGSHLYTTVAGRFLLNFPHGSGKSMLKSRDDAIPLQDFSCA